MAALYQQPSLENLDMATMARRRQRLNSIRTRGMEVQAEQAAREMRRTEKAKLVSTKYPKHDILLLKSVFDDYDCDDSGFISLKELKQELRRQKAQVQRYDGHKLTLHERQAMAGRYDGQGANEKGLFLLSFAETIFQTLDSNHDGRVCFKELLNGLYPLATPAEVTTMLRWVYPEMDEHVKAAPTLTQDQEEETRHIFNLYDADGSGTISRGEFRKAMRPSGMPRAYLGELFDSADQNANQELDFGEWRDLMRDAGLYTGAPLLKRPLTHPDPLRPSHPPSSPPSRAHYGSQPWTCPPSPQGKGHVSSSVPKTLRGSPSESFITRFQKRA